MEKFKNYINGAWVDAVSGKTFLNYNPANLEDIIGEFALSDKEDVQNAVMAAKEAYEKWRLVPAPKEATSCAKWETYSIAVKKSWPKL